MHPSHTTVHTPTPLTPSPHTRPPPRACAGNHEREEVGDDGEEPHFRGWLKGCGNNMPWEASNRSPFFYSTNVGPVHVISISPYVDFSAKSAQQRCGGPRRGGWCGSA